VQLLNGLVDWGEILCGDDDVEDDLDSNSVASTMAKWRTFQLLRRMHLLNGLVDLDEILYCGNGIEGDLNCSKMAFCLFPTNNF
jgi:hypothetical protein